MYTFVQIRYGYARFYLALALLLTVGYSTSAQTPATPTFSPSENYSPLPMTIQITCTTPGASIHYTTNGASPTAVDPPYTSATSVSVAISQSLTLTAAAWLNGVESNVLQQSYRIPGAIVSGNPDYYSYGLNTSGQLWSWGSNTYGQLGEGNTTTKTSPVGVTTLSASNGTLTMSTGFDFGAAVGGTGGVVYTWGLNSTGQLGIANTTNRSTPGTVKLGGSNMALTGALSVACGGESTYVLTGSHYILSWGDNSRGELGTGGTSVYTTYPTMSPSPSYVLSSTNPITYLGNITALAASGFDGVATDGTNVYTWGDNSDGQLGVGSSPGTSNYAQTISFPGLTVAQIGAGYWNSAAILSDGMVRAWGAGASTPYLVTTDGTHGLANVVAVALACDSTFETNNILALTGSGTVWDMGGDGFGELGNPGYPSGSRYMVPVLLANGQQLGSGTNGKVVGIGSGSWYNYAILASGTVVAWGENEYGSLGIGIATTGTYTSPVVSNFVAFPTPPPVAPSNLVITDSNGQVLLTWNGSPNATGYVITRTENGGNPVVLSTGTGTNYMDSGIIAGVAYSYNLSGSNVAGESGSSNTVNIVPIAAPTDVSASGSDGQVTLNWTDAEGAATYDIFRSTTNGTGFVLTGTTANNNFTDTSVTDGITYYYLAAGVSASGIGPTSSQVNATPELNNGFQTPQFWPLPGEYVALSNVSITCTSAGTTIHYTINGNDPTLSDPVVVSGSSIELPGSATLKARAFGESGNASTVAVADYLLTGLIDGGSYHAFAISTNGKAFSWGDQANGRLGNLLTSSSNVLYPHRVLKSGTTFDNAICAAGGYEHSLLVDGSGNVWACGDNSDGELGIDNSGITQTGTCMQVVTGTSSGAYLTGIANVSAGNYLSLATGTNGQVWAWGSNSTGRTGLKLTSGNQWYAAEVLTNSGTLSNIVSVSAGQAFGLAVDGTGGVEGWGDNSSGQLGQGNTTNTSYAVQVYVSGNTGPVLANITAIATGWDHSMAVMWGGTNNGTVWCWGAQANGRLGNGITTSGTVKNPVEVLKEDDAPLSEIVQVAAGPRHSLALDAFGNVWAWGYNANGELGDGTTTASPYAEEISIPVNPGTSIVYIGAGGYDNGSGTINSFSYALGSDGTIYSWGYDGHGELGNNTTSSSPNPYPTHYTSNPNLADTAPSVSLTGGSTSSIRPSTITLSATATSALSTITSVVTYQNGIAIGGSSTTISSPHGGIYSFNAVATDASGLTGTSNTLNVTITAPVPSITLTSPTNAVLIP